MMKAALSNPGYPRLLLVTLLMLFQVVAGRAVASEGDDLEATVAHLIDYVEQSDVQFKRNFTSHNAREAAEHMSNKYDYFRDEIDTPEKFIELCATRSLMTGFEYQVVLVDGETRPAGQWLGEELQRYRTQNALE